MDAPLLELWAPIAEAPDYEVSTWGRVRRGDELVESWTNKKGYQLVSLELADPANDAYVELPPTIVLRYVHRLVLSAFVEPPDGRLANHDDGRKANNLLDNLEWTTPKGNSEHARRTGLIPPRAPRVTCRHGHPLDQVYTQLDHLGVPQRRRRCSRCRRVGYRRRWAARVGAVSLPLLLERT